jgi:hypothetical protein
LILPSILTIFFYLFFNLVFVCVLGLCRLP